MLVESFDELKKTLNAFGCPYPGNQGGFFFRGIPNKNFGLVPPLFYDPIPVNPKQKEIEILNEFIQKTDFGKNKSLDEKIWVNAFYSRHWGLKSRLIDWSIDLSVALYFMQRNPTDQNAALFVLPKRKLNFLNKLPNSSYFDFNQTAILNPPFDLEDIQVIASKNRFIQQGRFLIQSYNDAGQCFYKKNSKTILKIEIPRENLKDIYNECCNLHDYDSSVELIINLKTDPFYILCTQLNT